MENYIVINGKKSELTKEQLEKLGIKIKTGKTKTTLLTVGTAVLLMAVIMLIARAAG